MSAKKQSRKWNLTINHPIEKGWTHEKLKTTLQGIASLTYYCMADEKGENEVFHTHIYIVSKNPKPFTTMKNFFPESHIEAPDGTSTRTLILVSMIIQILLVRNIRVHIMTPVMKSMENSLMKDRVRELISHSCMK